MGVRVSPGVPLLIVMINTRYKIIIEYDGSHFFGWQIQKDQPTVQGAIENALQSIFQAPIKVTGSGRTDTGVHARGQVAHFDTPRDMEPSRLQLALNHFLVRQGVSIVRCEKATADFHARFSAISRSYEYLVVNRSAPLALDAKRALHFYKPCDEGAMQEAARTLIGTHDFSAFRDSQCQARSPIKTLEEATVTRDGEVIRFFFKAPSFLHHQVRNMVGSLLMVGSGKWTPVTFREVLESRQRTKAGPTISPYGLYFLRADYTSGH